MNETWILYDASEEYVRRFLGYVRRREWLPGSVKGCWNPEELERLLREADAKPFLLASEHAWNRLEEERQRELLQSVGRFCLLTETQGEAEGEPGAVFRYQPMSRLIREVLRVSECGEEPGRRRPAAKLYGLCAPGGTEKLSACGRILARCLSETGRTLLVNFRSWTVWEGERAPEEERGLSDLLYRQRAGDSRLPLRELVEHLGTMDLLPGAASPLDLWEMTPEELTEVLEELRGCGEYDCLVAEFGAELAPEAWGPLCSRILLLREDTADSRRAAESFRQYLRDTGAGRAENLRELTLAPCPELKELASWDPALRYSRLGRQMEEYLTEPEGGGAELPDAVQGGNLSL